MSGTGGRGASLLPNLSYNETLVLYGVDPARTAGDRSGKINASVQDLVRGNAAMAAQLKALGARRPPRAREPNKPAAKPISRTRATP